MSLDINRLIIESSKKYLKEIKAIYLLGSQTTGFARTDSDIDIAILAEKALLQKNDMFSQSGCS